MFKFDHSNLHVMDLERSIKFYEEALDFTEITRLDTPSFIFVYLGDSYRSEHVLELQLVKNRRAPYSLGDSNFHLAFTAANFKKAYNKHKKMNCIYKEYIEHGIYWIRDPDGYLIEVLSEKWEMGR